MILHILIMIYLLVIIIFRLYRILLRKKIFIFLEDIKRYLKQSLGEKDKMFLDDEMKLIERLLRIQEKIENILLNIYIYRYI